MTSNARLHIVDPAQAQGPAKQLLDGIQSKLGATPNFFRVLANSPSTLEGFLAMSAHLDQGALPKEIGERIALAAAEGNGCQYCVSAHTAIARGAGLSDTEIEAARIGEASDPRADAVVGFAKALVENDGDVTSAEIQSLRDVGLGDGEIVEIIAKVALNTLTNYLAKVGRIDIDFPEVALLEQIA